jgi:hypothetical protein
VGLGHDLEAVRPLEGPLEQGADVGGVVDQRHAEHGVVRSFHGTRHRISQSTDT